jgi:hypothetical protein
VRAAAPERGQGRRDPARAGRHRHRGHRRAAAPAGTVSLMGTTRCRASSPIDSVTLAHVLAGEGTPPHPVVRLRPAPRQGARFAAGHCAEPARRRPPRGGPALRRLAAQPRPSPTRRSRCPRATTPTPPCRHRGAQPQRHPALGRHRASRWPGAPGAWPSASTPATTRLPRLPARVRRRLRADGPGGQRGLRSPRPHRPGAVLSLRQGRHRGHRAAAWACPSRRPGPATWAAPSTAAAAAPASSGGRPSPWPV